MKKKETFYKGGGDWVKLKFKGRKAYALIRYAKRGKK
jgi:hypothetical protein